MPKKQQFQICMAEVKQSQLRAEYYKARIDNKMYVNRKVRIGGHNGQLLTEAELLADEVATMHRHIQLAQEKLEFAYGLTEETQY